jgi:hypothetical protein
MLQRSVTVPVRADGQALAAQLDLADPHQVGRLCLEFACRERDVYIAVAMVGDSVQQLRKYLLRMLAPGPASPGVDLPPLWSSVLHTDAGA